jgi:hypothetical protein
VHGEADNPKRGVMSDQAHAALDEILGLGGRVLRAFLSINRYGRYIKDLSKVASSMCSMLGSKPPAPDDALGASRLLQLPLTDEIAILIDRYALSCEREEEVTDLGRSL